MRFSKKISTILVLFGILALMTAAAQANDVQTYKVTNTTGADAGDLHITFTGTGGSTSVVVMGHPAGCVVAAYPNNPPAVSNEASVVWTNDCVPPGGVVIIRVSTQNGPLEFDSGYWTNAANPNGPNGSGPVNAEDILEIPEVPSISTIGAVVLVLLLIASGIFVIRRRKATA